MAKSVLMSDRPTLGQGHAEHQTGTVRFEVTYCTTGSLLFRISSTCLERHSRISKIICYSGGVYSPVLDNGTLPVCI